MKTKQTKIAVTRDLTPDYEREAAKDKARQGAEPEAPQHSPQSIEDHPLYKLCDSERRLGWERAQFFKASAEKLAEALRDVVYTWEHDFAEFDTGYNGTPLEADYKKAKAALAYWQREK